MRAAPEAALIEARDVEFAYPAPESQRARPFRMRQVSFSMAPGEILGVVGPNSAGKTTLIRLLTKILEPSGGQVLIEGRLLSGLTSWEIARRVAVVSQVVPERLPFTVADLVLMGRYPHAPARFFESDDDVAIARDAMAAMGVLPLAHLPVEALSGGERQRAMLARALTQRPRALMLDEPTAHLDLRYQVECVALLRRLNREHGVGILLVSHDLGLVAELSDRLLLLADGRIARLGSPAEVLEETLLTEVYGCPVLVDTGRGGRIHVQVAWPEKEVRGPR
jgi:iron complex transport system ATP-binding protein